MGFNKTMNPLPPSRRIFGSLPQDLIEEALTEYDKQGDQMVYDSAFLCSLNGHERQSAQYGNHWSGLFCFVFGFATAKGWTSPELRRCGKRDEDGRIDPRKQ